MPEFVELDRLFALLRINAEATLENPFGWGTWRPTPLLHWADLQKERRVVVLGEAASGKSAEFAHQIDVLRERGEAAFLVRIEELADHGFVISLDPRATELFNTWRAGSADGWFYLDSIDEARLNRKSLEAVLTRFATDLRDALVRAHVYVSCRPSDWKSPDYLRLLQRRLPLLSAPPGAPAVPPEDPFVAPLLRSEREIKTATQHRVAENGGDSVPLIVQLTPLSATQCRTLAHACGICLPDQFMLGIQRSGLDVFIERPGDVMALVGYWLKYHQFACYTEMIEFGIKQKLEELDAFGPDNEVLSSTQAREGAERLAAALTLGKTFTLRAPGHKPPPATNAIFYSKA